MAQYGITKIMDGPRNAVFHVVFEGDGSGDLADVVLIDPATSFDPALPGIPSLTIDKLWYDLSGFDAKLEWGFLTSDLLIWSITGDQYCNPDLGHFGGLKDRSPSPDGNGKLKITTRGLGNGETGFLTIKVRKD
jgi:hypothetical protein